MNQSETLKNLRKQKGWSQAQFAAWLKIPKISYVQWEQEKRKAPEYLINLIKFKCENDTNQLQIKIVYLLWANYHVTEENILIGIYETYDKALEILKNVQPEYYADEIELYIAEKTIIK